MAAKDKGLLESVREKLPGGGAGDGGIDQGRRKALMKIGGAGAAAVGGNFAAEELTGRSLIERGEGVVSGGREPVGEAPANDTVNPNNPGYDNSKPGNTSNGTTGNGTVGNSTVENGTVGNGTDSGTVETPEDPDLTGEQIYFDWIHGENEEILEENKGEHGQISFNSVNKALEEGFEDGGRNQAIAQALETASQEYQENSSYEDRHRHILSALHTTLEQKEGEQWNFNVFSNMNYTQTVGDTLQFSEIKVETEETTDTGEDEYAIINAALNETMNHATHIPGEDKGDDGYKRTMSGVRESDNDTDLPPHDVEALRERMEGGDETGIQVSGAGLMGYQLFAGGHSVDSGFEFRPDEMLVPASKKIHEKIDEIGYEQGDRVDDTEGHVLGTHGRMDLQLAINERYMNEGYDEIDAPVVIDDLEETEEGWDFTLREEPDWNEDKGYPAQAS